EVVEGRGLLRLAAEALERVVHRGHAFVRLLPVGLEPPLPGGCLERAVGPAAEREHGPAFLLGDGLANNAAVPQEHDGARWCLQLLAVEGEPRPSGDDDVQLLLAGAFAVLLDDPAADVRRGVRVRPEALDAEPAFDRAPLEPFVHGDPRKVVEVDDLVRLHDEPALARTPPSYGRGAPTAFAEPRSREDRRTMLIRRWLRRRMQASEQALASEEDARRAAVRADDPQRQAQQLVTTRIDVAKVEALQRDHAAREQRPMRIHVADRHVVDPDQLDAAVDDEASP